MCSDDIIGGGHTPLQRLQVSNDTGWVWFTKWPAGWNKSDVNGLCLSAWRLSLSVFRAVSGFKALTKQGQILWSWCDYSCEMLSNTVYSHPNQHILRWRDGSAATSGGWNLQVILASHHFLMLLLCLLLNSCSFTLLYANFGSCD